MEFGEADLVGLPLRLTVSRRTVAQDAVERKPCHCEEDELVPMDALTDKLEELLVPDAIGLGSRQWLNTGGMINRARDQPDGED